VSGREGTFWFGESEKLEEREVKRISPCTDFHHDFMVDHPPRLALTRMRL
jgi:hypothetical protein